MYTTNAMYPRFSANPPVKPEPVGSEQPPAPHQPTHQAKPGTNKPAKKPLSLSHILLSAILGATATLATVHPIAPGKTALIRNRLTGHTRFVTPGDTTMPPLFLKAPLLEETIRFYDLKPQESELLLELADNHDQSRLLNIQMGWQPDFENLTALNTSLEADLDSYWKHLSEADLNQAVFSRLIRPLVLDGVKEYALVNPVSPGQPQALPDIIGKVIAGYTDEEEKTHIGLQEKLARKGILLKHLSVQAELPEE